MIDHKPVTVLYGKMTFKSINELDLPYFTMANITNSFLMSAKDFKVLTPSIHFSLYCVDAQLDIIHIIGVRNYFIRLILEFQQLRCACYVCIRGLQLPTMQLCACNCCLDHILPSIHTVQAELEPLECFH